MEKKLSIALLTSSILCTIQVQASPLQVGPGTVACEANANCTAEGVNFIAPTGQLTVTGVNIGENTTTGVSVTATGGTGGEIQFEAGSSTILGTVTAAPTPSTNLLKTITINDSTADVTAAGNLQIVNLNFAQNGIFNLNDGVNLIGTVTSSLPATGNLVFSGNSSTGGDISGLSTVSMNGGTVILNNNIAATSTIVNTGATLTVNQNGLILATNLANNGVLNLGLNHLTTTQYAGSADSVINIQIAQGLISPISGQLSIVASLNPALPTTSTLNLSVTGNDIPTSLIPVTVVTATPGTLFVGPVIPNTVLYNFTPDYTTGSAINIFVTRTQTMTQATAGIPALAGISGLFDSIGSNITTIAPGLVPAYDAIRAQQSLSAFNADLFSIIPFVNGHLRAASYLGASRTFNIANDRMGMPTSCDCLAIGCRKRGYWVEGTAGEILQTPIDSVVGYDADSGGFAFGADINAQPNVTLGWGFAYTRINTNNPTHASPRELKTNSYQGLVYGRYDIDNCWYIDGAFGFATNHYYQYRPILVPALDTATSSFCGWQFNVYAEGGYEFWGYRTFPFFCGNRFNKLYFTPYFAFSYGALIVDSYQEQIGLPSSAPLALSVQYDSIEEFKLGPGFKIAYELGCSYARFTPYFKWMILTDLIADGQSATASFAGLPDTSFRAEGPHSGICNTVSTVGFIWSKDNQKFFTVEYTYEHSDSAYKIHSGFIKYRYTWM